MYKSIISAVNEHTNSAIAARYAAALAGSCNAKLTLIYVSQDPVDKDALKKAESAQARLFAEAQEAGLDVESVVLKGDPARKIVEYAIEHKADIVFAASRRETPRRRFFVKTVSRELMIKLPCACAVLRSASMGRSAPSKILLPLRGGRAFIEERAYFAGMLAKGFGARVTLFHMPEPATSFLSGELRLSRAQLDEKVPADVRELSEYLGRLDIPCEIRTARGWTAGTITTEAAQKRDDLIVMGASQRGILATLIKGSPVEEVMKSPPCNLIIFRPKRAS